MQQFTTTLQERENGVIVAVIRFDSRGLWGKRVGHRERIGLKAGNEVHVWIDPRDKPEA